MQLMLKLVKWASICFMIQIVGVTNAACWMYWWDYRLVVIQLNNDLLISAYTCQLMFLLLFWFSPSILLSLSTPDSKLACSAIHLTADYSFMGARRHEQKGTLASPWQCNVILCISSYSKMFIRRIIYALFLRTVVRFWGAGPQIPIGAPTTLSLDPTGGLLSPEL